MAVCPMEDFSSILMRFRLIPLPLHIRSLRQHPPVACAVNGVLAEQSKTGLAGVEMEEALKTMHHWMKYWTGWSNISFLGRSFSKEMCLLVKSLSMAFTMSLFVSSSLW